MLQPTTPIRKLTEVRKNGKLNWLKPDGKSQVTIKNDENDIPIKDPNIVSQNRIPKQNP